MAVPAREPWRKFDFNAFYDEKIATDSAFETIDTVAIACESFVNYRKLWHDLHRNCLRGWIMSGKEIIALELDGVRDGGTDVLFLTSRWGSGEFGGETEAVGFQTNRLWLGFISMRLSN